MKARFARPTPQQVEPYFFEHLVHRAGNDAADASAAASPPTTEAAEQPTSWVLAPVTASKDINELLWAKFAPDDHKISIQNFVETEHRRTSALTEDLRDTWNKVEEVVSLNQHRHEFLCSEEVLEKLTSAIKDMVFWTAEDLTTHFHLEVAIGTEDTPEVDPNNEFSKTVSAARITLDFSVPTDRTNLPEDGETEGAAAVSIVDEEAGADTAKVLQKKAKAWSMTREDLLNPCKRPHCLRRLFAPLLQRRQELPKNTNLLLNELQEVQSKMLPRLEKSIERGIMFNIPLYIPFQITAQFISRYFSKESRTPSIEVAQVNRFRPMMASMKDLKRHVGEATVDATLLDAMSPEGRQDLSETMWRLLFEELQMHKAAHAEGMSKYRELSSASTEFLSDLNRAFGECTAASQQSMDLLVQDADSCAEALANTGTRTVVIVKEMGEAYERNSSLLKASIQKKEYAINKSEAQQEKLARRVREAVKDLHAEQLKYEELTQELLQERLTLSQLESSYEQVKKAIEIRHEGALDAQKRAEEVRCLLRAAEKARWSLVESCTKHIGRLTTDDYYRRCRIAGQCVSNAEQWSRCLHDMAFLYEERYNTVDRMAQASWQMSYLAAGERDWAVSNLAEVREELAGLESHFGDIASILADLELDVPALRDAATDEDKELRRKMRQLDEVRQVQRNVTTIKEFRRRLENPASGRGLGAARGLATGGGSTGASAPAYPAASETGGDDCRPGVKLPAISGKRASSESPRTEADESSKPSAERRPRTEKEDCLKKLEEVD